MYSLSVIGQIITSKALINSSELDPVNAYDSYVIATNIQWWIGVYASNTFNISHWIFAFKYWSLAVKLEYLRKGEDTDKLNGKFLIALVIGIVANFLLSMFFQLSTV